MNTTHAHALAELPDSVAVVKRVCGWCKYFGTRAVRELIEEFRDREIWAGGETYEPVDNEPHLRAAHNYILNKQGRDAWTWSLENGAKCERKTRLTTRKSDSAGVGVEADFQVQDYDRGATGDYNRWL